MSLGLVACQAKVLHLPQCGQGLPSTGKRMYNTYVLSCVVLSVDESPDNNSW